MLITTNVRAFICREPVDMRKSIDGLSYLVEPMLKQNPASGNLFVFVARDRSKVKCLNCVFWTNVTGRFGIVTDDFGNVTGHFGDVTERTGRQDWRCA